MANITESELLNFPVQGDNHQVQDYKVYKKRWLILILFIFFSISNCVHYIEFSIIADLVTEYYQVSYSAVDWSTTIASVMYVVVGIPATYVVDKIGVRKTVIVGIIGTSVGSWLKVGSVHPDRFWLVIFAQGILSTFQLLIYPLLPKLASTWFGYHQISTAVGLGSLGYQIGFALSFILPSLIVLKETMGTIEKSLYIMNISYAIFATILMPLLFVFFSEAPPTPPSYAQQHALIEKRTNPKGLIETCKTILFNKSFILFSIIFGLNTAALGPLMIMSNQVIQIYYPGSTFHSGIIGLLATFFSLFGSIIISIILDKFKKEKLTSCVLHFLLLLLVAFYSGTIDQGLGFVYLTTSLIGMSSGCIIISGIGLATELTYPEPEGLCIGILYTFSQIMQILFIILYGYIYRTFSILSANLTLLVILLVADLLLFFLKFDLRKKAIENSKFENSNV